MNAFRNAACAALLALTACATPYQSKGVLGGYSEKKIDDGVYQVEYKGNNYTDAQMARDFALLRAAELAHLSGYRYFVIRNTESNFRNPAGDKTRRIAGTPFSVGQVGVVKEEKKQPKPFSRTFVRHTIQCYKEKPSPDKLAVYETEQVEQELRRSYNLK
jgi:hypothetical protein